MHKTWRQLTKSTFGSFAHWWLIPAIAAIMVLWPTVSSGLNQLQTDPGDVILNIYFLEHSRQHLTSLNILQPSLFWSPDFFWPIKNTLAWSDHLLGPSLLYSGFRLFMPMFTAYTAWLFTTLMFNYMSVRWALTKISPYALPSWISAISLLAAFSPAITRQLDHPQLLSLYLIGPILALCNQLITSKVSDFTASHWLFLGALILANGFFNIYIFTYTFFGAAICIAIHILKRIKQSNLDITKGDYLLPSIALITGSIAVNFYIYSHYINSLKTFGKRDINEIISNLPEPLSWFTDSSQLLIGAPFHTQTLPSEWLSGVEQDIFPGWGLLIGLAAALLTVRRVKEKEQKKSLLLWLVVIGVMITLTLNWQNITLWPFVSKLLPGAGSLRASSRVGIFIILFSSAPISIAASEWKFKYTSIPKIITESLLLTLSFATIWRVNFYTFSLQNWETRQAHLNQSLSKYKSNCDVFWVQHGEEHPVVSNIQALHAQLITGIPTLNGYSGHRPKGQRWAVEKQSFDQVKKWLFSSSQARKHQWKTVPESATICELTNQNKLAPFNVQKYQFNIKK